MSLNKLIIDTLKPLNIPVSFQTYPGNASTYITFFEYNQNGTLHADDDEEITSHYLQVDVWSKADYTETIKQVKGLLKEKGFRRTFEKEFFEPDTKIFHKVLRFIYCQFKEEY